MLAGDRLDLLIPKMYAMRTNKKRLLNIWIEVRDFDQEASLLMLSKFDVIYDVD